MAHGAPRAVVAPAEGVVEYAGPLKGWGMVVILRLGGGYHLVLAGLHRRRSASGERPGPASPRPHGGGFGRELYFEVRKNGTPTDPAPWLNSGKLRPERLRAL